MAKDVLLKKDRILEESLVTLQDSPFAETLIFQGGGALPFIYSSPRYSGDVDFVDSSITNDIDNYLKKIVEVGNDYEINNAKIMPSGRGVRAKWGHKENEPVAKVEIEERDADEYYPSHSKFNLFVKTPGDIYTDKIFSNIARYVSRKPTGQFPFKPNDFFDLQYICNTLGTEPVEKERIMKRAEAYHAAHIVNYENLTEMINMITNEENHDFFRKCLRKTMMKDFYNVMNFDKKFFDKVAGHFENYR